MKVKIRDAILQASKLSTDITITKYKLSA